MLLALANDARGFQAAHFRHHDVHEDQVVGLAVQRGERFDAVGGEVGAVAHLLEQAEGDLLVDDVVVAQQHAQRQAAGEGGIELGVGGGFLGGGFGAGDDADQDFVKLGGLDRLGQATGEGGAGEVRMVGSARPWR